MRLLIVFSTLAVAVFAGYEHHHAPDVHSFEPYHGPLAPLAHDGRVVDTPEVAHAKAAHFHAFNEELSKASHHAPAVHYEHHEEPQHHHHEVAAHHEIPHHPVAFHHEHEHHGYHGPPAPLAHDGRVVDTPEVAHAKAAHFHAYAEELSKVSHAPHHHHQEHHEPQYHHF